MLWILTRSTVRNICCGYSLEVPCKTYVVGIHEKHPAKHMLWYSLEAPRQGAANAYPQHIFIEK